ncbi:uncharacterized protein [Clytia hemisphaerica]|uniref:uncharacterized protein n=1 Tax=Clytia hemisphaerica TaxID=252671 RepID=UPI0034D56D1D
MTNIRIRNAGPTSTLCNKAVKARNEKIHKLVEYASFGDISSYVSYVCDHYFDTIVESAIQSLSENNLKKFIKTLKVVKKPVTLESKETARIMMGKYDMSQRAFKELRATLKSCNVTLPSYDDLREYCKNLEVGNIFPLHGSNESECQCMGYGCTVKDTLERVFGCNEYQHKLSFIEADRNKKLGDFLKSKNTHLYQNFKNERRTIILRDTGDNFRGAGRYPTEQTSFSIMNIQDLVSGPYGQFITTLWRGSESRETLEMHCKHHYQELSELVKNGIRLTLNGEVPEEFNVVVFLVADLAFVKEVLGKCSCTQAYGCFHCKLNINQWSSCKANIGESRTMNEMNVMGSAARSKLGDGPNKDSAAYKNLIANNYGQWAPVLFEGVVIELIPPCGLHLILAHHRYLWKFMHDIISKRNQESLIPVALRKIGCTYIAFQIESYFKSKKKHYDGSEKLKMIGNDCKLLESNIDTFLNEFVEDKGDDWNSPRSRKLLQVLRLYKRFADLAVDIRSLNGNEERIATFEKRAEEYFQKFLLNAGSAFVSKLPYMHYLRQHIGSLMQTYYNVLGWGYGYERDPGHFH